jgi:hypothetical protein
MAQDTKIYLKLDKRPKNVDEVLKLFWNKYGSNETFHDKECTKQQCGSNKGRSFDDLYYCCKTYFPNVTVKKVFHEVVIYNLNNKVFAFMNCSGIRKIKLIAYPYQLIINSFGNIYKHDCDVKKYDSIWSWKELHSMLDIKSNNDLTNYRKKYNVKLK